ncbi:MAG: tripartite tricarboxylate transporter substrate binding protein [Acetobacteraceae bacterium]|nr:tripartite tricarboxylate transporter substrate binding protein [Acetobacteraceae bacterium]
MTTPALPRRALLGGLLALPVARAASAQEAPFPNRPLRLIYPFATGAGDVVARAIAERLRETLGQPMVVENKPGANTMIGAETAARAPKDGYTLGWVATSTLALNPHFYPNIPYRLEDFAPLCLVYRAPLALAVTAQLPITTLAQAVAHMKANPGLGFGTVGNGSSPHLMMELFQAGAGVTAVNVAYRGEQPILSDLFTGRIPFFAGSVATVLPHADGGRLRILAVSAPARIAPLPGVPTFAEAGHPDATYEYWHGMAAPAGTPEPILQRLSDAIAEAVRSDFVVARASPDWTLDPRQRGDFTALIRADAERLGGVIRERRITV